MAHYAELDAASVVTRVIVVSNQHDTSEASGVAWCESFFAGGTWKKTSFNATIRKNFAGVGFTYDAQRDAFIPPKPDEDAWLDEETCRWVVDAAD